METTHQARRAPRPSGWRRWRPLVWRGGVSLVALAALLLVMPVERLGTALAQVGAARWLLVLGAVVGLQGVAALKWRLLVRAVGVDAPWRDLIRAHASGLFANNFLPSLVGGDVVRVGLLARSAGRPEALAVSVLADRCLDAGALLLLAGVGGALAPGAVEPRARRLFLLLGLLLIAAVAAAPLVARLVDLARLPAGLRRMAGEARAAGKMMATRPGSALRGLLLALLVQGSLLGLNVHLGGVIGLEAPVAGWLLVWPLAKLSALVPVSLGGLGVRQLAMSALFLPFAVEPGLAVAQSLLWESLLVALGLVGGGLALWIGAGAARPRR